MTQRQHPTRRRAWWRIPLWPVAALLVLLLASLIYLRTSLPKSAGTVTLPGLAENVEIVRDANAVPHIFAQSREDALFALGFVHAQDRLFQMDFQRRVGAGRLSEVLGEATLDTDKFLRTLGVYNVARKTLPNLDPETQGALEAYAAGVNAFLAQRKGALPPEFLILGYTPEPWTPADSLVWLKMMAWDLSGNWSDELMRARLLKVLPPERVAQLWPPYPGDAPVALPDFSALYKKLPLESLAAIAPKPLPPGSGSNNWVLSGARTVTGKPLLANDPHLALQTPALWYLAQLSAPGLSVTGATLPGLPLVVLGHTDQVAWGFTNTGPDTQDLFLERLRGNRYLTPNGWQPVKVRREVIRVKGQADVTLDVRETRHGPLVSDVSGDAADVAEVDGVGTSGAGEDGTTYALAFGWTALRTDDRSMEAGLELNSVQNWDDFTAALRNFHAPEQNIVYADTSGNIGFYAPARVPIRKAGNGQVPVPGWTGEYDWDGFIPFEALPHAYNPASGQIVTANQKIVPDGYPYFITQDWTEPYRAERITALLNAQEKLSRGGMERIQADRRSLMTDDFLPLLLRAPVKTPEARALQSRLAVWDGQALANTPEPLVFSAWYGAFTRLVLEDDLGSLFGDYWGFRPLFFRNVLRGEQAWCDNSETTERESCALVAATALEQAWDDLSVRFGDDPERWRWGEVHYADHDHPVFGQTPLGPLFNLRVSNGGDPFTVNAAGYDLDGSGAQTSGPGFRAVYDLADLSRSTFIQTTGQSGNVFSAHYRDFVRRWANVESLPILTERSEVERDSLGTLTLLPE